MEETSFRAKSIEGVGTSTTAFVGPSRKGPIAQPINATPPPAPPELLTSFGDFVRVFGGLESLDFGPDGKSLNFLAHAALNYFNEGGGRLYVVRVAAQDAKPALKALAGAGDADVDRVILKARFPGSAGNGRVSIREILAGASPKNLADAPAGSLLRSSAGAGVEPATLTGRAGPFSVREGGLLRLRLAGGDLEIAFHGKSTEAITPADLPDVTELKDDNHTLRVTIDGQVQDVTLPNRADYSPQGIALELNARLNNGYARVEGKKLVIGSRRKGRAGTVKVGANAAFGFPADLDGVPDPAANNVPDLSAVTVADLGALLDNTKVTVATVGGMLAISTVEKGKDAKLSVVDVTNTNKISEHHAFGLEPPAPGASPAQGSNARVFKKMPNGAWTAADATNFANAANPDGSTDTLISLSILVEDASGDSDVFDDVTLVPNDPRYIGKVLNRNPDNRAESLRRLVWLDLGPNVDPLAIHSALFSGNTVTGDFKAGRGVTHTLAEGTDGAVPTAGDPTVAGSYAAALDQLGGLEDVSIVAAPGHSSFKPDNFHAIQSLLIQHVEKPRAYRIGVLETPRAKTPGEARTERGRIDSHRVALYYPWVTVANPLARPGSIEPQEIDLPPSGFICGIYARNDVEHDVSKAPANEVVRSALRFESDINFAQNQLLNPLGVNCLRFFPGRGYRVWGARTASSDPEWKYVNVRRYFNYLEASIDRGTQWAVFENNGRRLWQNIRETIEDFLYNEWISNRLLGDSPKEAYFVRCDRSTMTQNDLDNGRLICLIGVAALKPAEFVIFRIGQKTADARS